MNGEIGIEIINGTSCDLGTLKDIIHYEVRRFYRMCTRQTCLIQELKMDLRLRGKFNVKVFGQG